MTTKTWKKPLRTLSATQLQSVAGGISFLGMEERGIIIYGSGASPEGSSDGAVIIWRSVPSGI